MTRILLICALCFTLTACSSGVTPLSKEDYTKHLGNAVCTAVQDINARGALSDEQRFTALFEKDVQAYVAAQGITPEVWIASKEEHYSAEEHAKLVKLFVTNCLLPIAQ